MKTLANCTPREFLAQTHKISKRTASWLSKTEVLEIRKNKPEITPEMTPEQIEKAQQEQARKNINEMLDRMLGEFPEETAELLGLLCFIEPEDLDNHRMVELLAAATELLNCPEVIGFFTSLMRLGQSVT